MEVPASLSALLNEQFDLLAKDFSAELGLEITKTQVIWAHSRVLRQGRDVDDPDFNEALTQAVLDAVALKVDVKSLWEEGE